jgi:hypothetical protein
MDSNLTDSPAFVPTASELSDAPAEAAWSPRAIGDDTIGYESAAPWLQAVCGLDAGADLRQA